MNTGINKQANPWQTLKTEEVYSNPWIKVEEHSVLNPSGKPGIYGKVCARGRTVGVVALDDYANIWLVGQYRYPVNSYSWEIPEGAGERNEDPLEAAKRELREETGLIAGEWRHLLRLHTSNCVSDEEAIVFLARKLTKGESSPDETEQLVIKKLPFPLALDMVLKEEITDAISVAAILKTAQLDLAGERVKILYEDEYCVAVNKPAGLLVHRTSMSRDRDFLLQRVRNQIKTKITPVHRLDKPTSGIVLFGKDEKSVAQFSAMFQSRNVRKTYLAVVRGFTEKSGIIEHPLKNHLKNNIEQEAVTEYKTLSTTELPIPVGPYDTARYSLVEINLKTGRTHQIRRHFNHISHPIVGDTSYGDREHNRMFRDKLHCGHLLLMANKLEFTHPVTGKPISITAELDDEFSRILGKLNLK